MANRTPLFVVDHTFSLYEVYSKDQLSEGENRSYKKKVTVEEVVSSFYDEELQNLMIISKNIITQVRNDKNNNFNILNGIFLEGFAPISKANFCQRSKAITLLTNDQMIYQLKNY